MADIGRTTSWSGECGPSPSIDSLIPAVCHHSRKADTYGGYPVGLMSILNCRLVTLSHRPAPVAQRVDCAGI
jgi:hypothetical protein